MADTDVGKRGIYHSQHGDAICWVLEYEAGRPEGDHFIAGFEASGAQGDVFRLWTVAGSEQGAFEVS